MDMGVKIAKDGIFIWDFYTHQWIWALKEKMAGVDKVFLAIVCQFMLLGIMDSYPWIVLDSFR